MTVKKFEDLDCWKESRTLVKTIYSLTGEGLFGKDFGLRDQIRRASVSVMANIAEGFGANSNPEFVRFLKFAVRSCFEVQSHLYEGNPDDITYEFLPDDPIFLHASSSALTQIVTGLQYASIYYFRVRAVNLAGLGEYSAVSAAFTTVDDSDVPGGG